MPDYTPDNWESYDWFLGAFDDDPPFRQETVDDIVIGYVFEEMDGTSGTLAEAGPRKYLITETGRRSVSGMMRFDIADFNADRLTGDNAEIVITHEMGHCLGAIDVYSLCGPGQGNAIDGCTDAHGAARKRLTAATPRSRR